ncbi:MAG: NAD(P)H-hydrate dehydratase [Nitrospiria bacterium]
MIKVYVVTAAEMKALDERATSEYLIPSLLLMENAARGFVDAVESLLFPVKDKRVVILAGRGNNGGDGLAAARHFRMRGAEVVVFLLSDAARVQGDAKVSLDIWCKTGGELYAEGGFTPEAFSARLQKSDLVVDAFLGTGLSHAVRGERAALIEAVNQHAKTVVAVDIPSGISADDGQILGTAVRADATVTMALPKRGHFMGGGLTHCGALRVVDIGFPAALVEGAGLKVTLITPEALKDRLPRREKGAHKGTMGHVLVVGGSPGKQGAPQMTARAAFRAGAGLVTVALPESIEGSASLQLVEAMTIPLPVTETGSVSVSAQKALLHHIEGKRVVAVGPGLSQHPDTQDLVLNLIKQVTIPMVIDADGINAVAGNLSVLKEKKGPVILTPHPGEMGRLIGKSAAEVQRDRFNIAAVFAETWGVMLVLKGPHTLVAFPDGRIWVNTTGNPGMAAAGVGDALTGVIAACAAPGASPENAALAGVYLHGRAGDLAARDKGETGMMTSDLIESLPEAVTSYFKGAATA